MPPPVAVAGCVEVPVPSLGGLRVWPPVTHRGVGDRRVAAVRVVTVHTTRNPQQLRPLLLRADDVATVVKAVASAGPLVLVSDRVSGACVLPAQRKLPPWHPLQSNRRLALTHALVCGLWACAWVLLLGSDERVARHASGSHGREGPSGSGGGSAAVRGAASREWPDAPPPLPFLCLCLGLSHTTGAAVLARPAAALLCGGAGGRPWTGGGRRCTERCPRRANRPSPTRLAATSTTRATYVAAATHSPPPHSRTHKPQSCLGLQARGDCVSRCTRHLRRA